MQVERASRLVAPYFLPWTASWACEEALAAVFLASAATLLAWEVASSAIFDASFWAPEMIPAAWSTTLDAVVRAWFTMP